MALPIRRPVFVIITPALVLPIVSPLALVPRAIFELLGEMTIVALFIDEFPAHILPLFTYQPLSPAKRKMFDDADPVNRPLPNLKLWSDVLQKSLPADSVNVEAVTVPLIFAFEAVRFPPVEREVFCAAHEILAPSHLKYLEELPTLNSPLDPPDIKTPVPEVRVCVLAFAPKANLGVELSK